MVGFLADQNPQPISASAPPVALSPGRWSAKASLGIAIMSDYVAHRELHTSRRIRLVFDALHAFITKETTQSLS